jgi:hypothetical protein
LPVLLQAGMAPAESVEVTSRSFSKPDFVPPGLSEKTSPTGLSEKTSPSGLSEKTSPPGPLRGANIGFPDIISGAERGSTTTDADPYGERFAQVYDDAPYEPMPDDWPDD